MTRYSMFTAMTLALTASLVATPLLRGDAEPPLHWDHAIDVVGNFAKKGKDATKASTDVSGLACAPASNNMRTCLAIDDEALAAQLFTFDGTTIKTGDMIALIDKASAASAFGTPPATTKCPDNDPDDKGDFKDIDGEGVAYDSAAAYFYIVGSHGCSRSKGKFSLASFITARVKVGDATATQTTYRLADALAKADPTTFGTKLGNKEAPTADGMNVEGIVVSNGMMYVGLRAPSGVNNLLVGVEVAALFKPGDKPYDGKTTVMKLPLNANEGVRDLSLLPDGRLLILTGPTREEDMVPYRLYVASLSDSAVTFSQPPVQIELPEQGAKAEGVLPLDKVDGKLLVIIVFDGLANGKPHEYRVPLAN